MVVDTAFPLPHISRLQEKIKPGQTLVVAGKVLENAGHFSVDLDGSDGHKIFHANWSNETGSIYLTKSHCDWGNKENFKTPYKRGQDFEFQIRFQEDKLEILVKDKVVHESSYHNPLEGFDTLQVDGDIVISKIYWQNRNLKVPFHIPFPDGSLKVNERILICGFLEGESFEIDFIGANGDSLSSFKACLKQKTMLRNTQSNGILGKEEYKNRFPFKKHEYFDLVILNERYSLKFYVNNEPWTSFAHRTAKTANEYYSLKIDGDLKLTGVNFLR